MIKVYIAGPFTTGNISRNISRAIDTAEIIASMGAAPFIPHLNHFWDLIYGHSYNFWMKQDEEWLLQCDALLRIGGESPGGDKEVAIAKENNIPVFYSSWDFQQWMNR